MSIISHDSEIPATGQQVMTACAFIHADFNGVKKVFLPRRAATKKFLPNVFELPGGHIDFGEDPIAGLKREIKEEFNKDTAVGSLFHSIDYTNPIKGSHSFELIYFAQFIDESSDIQLNPEDHSEYVWVAFNELDTVYTEAKGADDDEFKAIRHGFRLLNGEALTF